MAINEVRLSRAAPGLDHQDAAFAVMLRSLRVRRGLSQEDLAEGAGVSARSIRALETGQVRFPRPETARLLASGLGLAGQEFADFVRIALVHHRETTNEGLSRLAEALGVAPGSAARDASSSEPLAKRRKWA